MDAGNGRIIHRFTRERDGMTVDVDVTEAFLREAKLSLAGELLREFHADAAYRALEEAAGPISGEFDADRCPVVAPKEFEGRPFGEVKRELALASMTDEQRAEAIEAEVVRFSAELDMDALAAEVDAAVDGRGPMEVSESVSAGISALSRAAIEGVDDPMEFVGTVDAVARSWLSWLGVYVLQAASEGDLDSLEFVREVDAELGYRLDILEELASGEDVPEALLENIFYGSPPLPDDVAEMLALIADVMEREE